MKVLIMGINSVSTFECMGKTFCSLFSYFSKNELCQLYIYPNIPNIDICDSYYRITDKDALKGLFTRVVKGREIKSDEIHSTCGLFENGKDESLYRNRKNKTAFRKIARDLIWFLSPWFNRPLKKWLKQNGITHIFVAPGESLFVYNIALKCARFLNVPIIAYICDEFYFHQKKKTFIAWFHYQLFKKKFKQFMKKVSSIVVISEELKELYEPYFKKPVHVIMTGSSFPISSKLPNDREITELTYMGNIRCNRYKSLCDIGDALDEINMHYKKDYSLNVYCNEKDPFILDQLSKRKSIKMKGFVTGSDFEAVFHSAQCFLHVESFDEDFIIRVKNSISTKIADCLGSGKPFIAYGPASIASMKHLKRNQAAFLIENKDELQKKLVQFFSMPEKEPIIRNALGTANKYHTTEFNGKMLYEIIGIL